MYSVKGREIKCSVSREGKSSVKCHGKGNEVLSVKEREVKCRVSMGEK